MSGIKKLSICAVFVTFLVLCAYITVPFPIPFTMQLFAVSLSCLMLGGKTSSVAAFTYVLLGSVGLPVFSAFSGGIGVVFGPTGGFLMFLPVFCLLFLLFSKFFEKFKYKNFLSLFCALIFLYVSGALWYFFMFTERSYEGLVLSFTTLCLPFIIPDILKILLAVFIDKKLYKVKNRYL